MRTSSDESDHAALQALGRRLARHRLNRNLTQAALAAQAGVSTPTVQRIEQGQSSQAANLIRILRALGLLENLDALVPEPARVRLFFVGGRISLCGSEAGGNWIRHGVVREQRRGPVADGTCAVSDGWGCSAGTRALGGGSQYASMRRRPVAA